MRARERKREGRSWPSEIYTANGRTVNCISINNFYADLRHRRLQRFRAVHWKEGSSNAFSALKLIAKMNKHCWSLVLNSLFLIRFWRQLVAYFSAFKTWKLRNLLLLIMKFYLERVTIHFKRLWLPICDATELLLNMKIIYYFN